MFAINCLKANGTHLGTCIDKFYFGSCCHIPPVSDIENTIDTDIIPSREPPHRLSTLKPVITTLMHDETTLSTASSNTTTTTIETSSTTLSTTSTTTSKPTTISTKEEKTTTESKISTTFNVQNFSKLPAVVETETEVSITTAAPKLTTFLSIDGSSSTIKLDSTTPSTTTVLTSKPTLSSTKITSRPTKPSKPTTKPYSKPTTKPSKTTTRTKPTTTSKPAKISKPSKTTTRKPATVRVPISTRSPSTRPTKRPVVTRRPSTTTTVKITTKAPLETTTKTSPNITLTTIPTVLAENITSNEIPIDTTASLKPATPTVAVTTEKPALITWTVDDIKRNSTETESSSISSTTPEDWKPITTPDGWVLLPSVSSVSGGPSPTKAPEIVTTSTLKDEVLTTTTDKVTPVLEANVTTQTATGEASNATVTTTVEEETTTPASTEEATNATSTSTSTTEIPKTNSSTTETTDALTPPVNMSDFTDVCGRRMFPEARIVGGEKSSFGKWPWQISLRQWRTSTYLHKCGAALLNENWAITAAHCVDNVPPSDLLLRLGEHDLSTESEPYLHQERRVQIVASHPQFDPRTFEYDLALLRFYEPVTFQPNIVPVCVPQSDENFVGRTAHVTGWGRLYEDGPLPSVLQEVSVPVINNSVCESMYRSAGYIEHIPHIFICAGWRRGGFDSCEGDSGGPMVIQRDDKRFLLAGVISWGIGCAEPNQPGVYTRISEFRDWINQILQF